MGLSAAGALIAITLSWLGQSPQLARRLGLSGIRLDLRVRALTGYALALLLLAVAFFLAGVPLGSASDGDTLAEQGSTPAADSGAPAESSNIQNGELAELAATPATPETGAFSGPPDPGPSPVAEEPLVTEDEPEVTRVSPPLEPTRPITPTTGSPPAEPSSTATSQPTATATPPPTETPFPTLTPTTIAGETAVVSTGGSTLWLKRSPGGQNVVLIRNGDIVLILSGKANQGGLLWREVATVAGVEGWLQDEFLVDSDADSGG